MALNKKAILAANDVKLDGPVNVPEWGGDVFIKTLSGTERDSFEESYSTEKMKNFRSRFLVLTLSDDKGARLFTDDEVDQLGGKSAIVINRLFDKAWAVNAFRSEDVEALGKDSPSDQSGGSTSA
jgi:hypothetical protein